MIRGETKGRCLVPLPRTKANARRLWGRDPGQGSAVDAAPQLREHYNHLLGVGGVEFQGLRSTPHPCPLGRPKCQHLLPGHPGGDKQDSGFGTVAVRVDEEGASPSPRSVRVTAVRAHRKSHVWLAPGQTLGHQGHSYQVGHSRARRPPPNRPGHGADLSFQVRGILRPTACISPIEV